MLKNTVYNLLKKNSFRKRNIYITPKTEINTSTVFEGYNYAGDRSQLRFSVMGLGSYVGDDCILNCAQIKRFCSIGTGVTCISGQHPVNGFVSTHPAFYAKETANHLSFCSETFFDEFKYADENNKFKIVIGNDVWIGNYAHIMEGVTIGDGAVIAAGAVVTKDVPPYALVAGVPAKLLRYRFDENEISSLLNSAWWDRDIEWLRENADNFRKINDFKEKCL